MNKILIANRGEIAVRIIRACKEMNIKTVAVYSEADKEALHTKLADEAICIGPANPKQSYLNIKNIIEAANITKTDSIHPGFGFLSENAEFAKICEESNIKFIGPKSNVINLLGNKSNSKKLMQQEGVPTIPGSDGSVKNLKEAVLVCEKIGYPVLLKASAGGGGKGIRQVNSFDELETNYNIVKQEAKNAFNDDEIYIEKFIQNPRHVEIQILADEHGNIVHLGERDCSLQRNHQKTGLIPGYDEQTSSSAAKFWRVTSSAPVFQCSPSPSGCRRNHPARGQFLLCSRHPFSPAAPLFRYHPTGRSVPHLCYPPGGE